MEIPSLLYNNETSQESNNVKTFTKENKAPVDKEDIN
jgi:hypothetical protein